MERAVELSQTARALAGGQPNAAGALATAIEARAHARTGDRTKALAAIRRSEAIFDRLQPWETEENVLGFYEQLFRFYQSNVLTYIGETKAALASQQRALELSPPEMEIDPVLIRLDRATCLVHEGEVAEGCHSASRALLSLSPEARRGTPTTRAHELVKMIPSGANRIGAVRDLREILQGALMPPSLAGSVRGTA
ncbi:MAG: hypothetical protein J2P17_30485 [Mycobacterium sp.]|nr:hypothetical protein [Mycobacterium sp.]